MLHEVLWECDASAHRFWSVKPLARATDHNPTLRGVESGHVSKAARGRARTPKVPRLRDETESPLVVDLAVAARNQSLIALLVVALYES
jgi:hypothetical protein